MLIFYFISTFIQYSKCEIEDRKFVNNRKIISCPLYPKEVTSKLKKIFLIILSLHFGSWHTSVLMVKRKSFLISRKRGRKVSAWQLGHDITNEIKSTSSFTSELICCCLHISRSLNELRVLSKNMTCGWVFFCGSVECLCMCLRVFRSCYWKFLCLAVWRAL